MEWSEGGEWDNCNSIINKYILFKKEVNFIIKETYNEKKKRKKKRATLSGVAQWIECQPVNQRVTV